MPTHHILCHKNWSHRAPLLKYTLPGLQPTKRENVSITSGSQYRTPIWVDQPDTISVSPVEMVFSSSIFLYSRARLQVKNQSLKGKTDTFTYCNYAASEQSLHQILSVHMTILHSITCPPYTSP